MSYRIGDEVWIAYRSPYPTARPRKGVVSCIYCIDNISNDKREHYKIIDAVSKRTIGRGIAGENIFLSEDEAWEAYHKEMKRRGRLPLPREERKEVEEMPGPNKKVEVHCSVFDYVSAHAAEAIHLITQGKKNDRLSLNEAQAIKVLCEMCIDCFNYLDEMQEKNAIQREDSSERSDQEAQ